MAAGLEVYTDSGVLQITESFRNYLLRNKVVITGTLRNDFPYYGRFYELDAPTGSMVACQPVDNTFVALYSTTINGATTRYTFVSPISGALLGTSATCTFFIFSLDLTPPSVSYGLEVYDASGRLCFSSNNQYMKPRQTWSGADYQSGMAARIGQGGFTYIGRDLATTIPRGSSAFVFSGPSGYVTTSITTDGDGTFYYDEDVRSCMAGWRGSTLILADELVGGRSFGPVNFPPPSREYYYTQFYHMVVDVSNY